MPSDILLHDEDELELVVGTHTMTVRAHGGRLLVEIPEGHVRGIRQLRADTVHADTRLHGHRISANTEVRVGRASEAGDLPGRVVVRGPDGRSEAVVLDGGEGSIRLALGTTIIRQQLRLPTIDTDVDGPSLEELNEGTGGIGGGFGGGILDRDDDTDDHSPQLVEVDLIQQVDTLRRQVAELQEQVADLQRQLP